jgi:hypothetical protein
MRFRNDTDLDAAPFGIHLAKGSTVEVADTLDQAKLEYLRRNFTVVWEKSEAVTEEMPSVPRSLGELTLLTLRDIARERGLTGIYQMSKGELIEALEAAG